MVRRTVVLMFVLAMLAVANAAFAQGASARLSGTVVDSSGAALPGVAVPTLAFNTVAAPAAFTIATVLVALNTGFNVALPTVNPVGGAVSDVPAVRVKVTGPVMAVTPFRAVKALANEV